MRRAANRDVNEREIIDALVIAGCSVQQLDGTDVPDLLVGRSGRTYLLEVKSLPGKRGGAGRDGQKLSSGQELWHKRWRGHVAVVRTVHEAFTAVGVSYDVD